MSSLWTVVYIVSQQGPVVPTSWLLVDM